MTAGKICTRNVVVAPEGEAIVDAAKRMRMFHVGDVVVVENRGGRQVPVGILTDRDIVLSIVASDPSHLPFLVVRDAMSSELVTAKEDVGVTEAIAIMQERGVRRLPVVDAEGGLVGILTFDDIVRFFAGSLNDLVKLMASEQMMEQRYRV
jgi:CBS domain-containing protein